MLFFDTYLLSVNSKSIQEAQLLLGDRATRKSPLSTTTLSFDAPAPANPREYLHKPYTARNYVPWATFLSLTVYG